MSEVVATRTHRQQRMDLFKACFGYLFPDCSKTMVTKCWRQVDRELDAVERDALIEAMKSICTKHVRRKK